MSIQMQHIEQGKLALQELIFFTAWFNVFILANGTWLYPVLLIALLTLVLIIKIWKISIRRKSLSVMKEHRILDSKKEMQATITMVFLGTIQFFLYIPSRIFAGLYYSHSILLYLNFAISVNFAYILAALARASLSLTAVCHICI